MNNNISLYIHIPFCVRKCLYCDFPSFALPENCYEDYVRTLCREIEEYSSDFKGMKVKTIFFGGGTPSVLPPKLLGRIIDTVMSKFDVADDAEISIETNPGTLDMKKLTEMKSMYFNRLSMGLQAWQDRLLKKIGRIHTADVFETNYLQARDAGFKNINVDLMFALPTQTLDDWQETLEKIIKLNPEHISAYSLIIEEGTPFYDMYEKGIIKEMDENLDREMYYLANEMLADKGYRRYEISNFSKHGFESRHNIVYWRTEEYRGFGMGAHSYVNGERFRNTYDFKKYSSFEGLSEDREVLTEDEKQEEFMFMGLRMTDGISENTFKERFSKSIYDVYGKEIRELTMEKLLISENDRLFLSDRGVDVSN
ncbi:MAG: radical SAM family heme chaperone HemW, partial [Clostridiales bacterium]|nr:radical SAM family heme chaperone HemW [Clostridiales bacterium]